MKNNIIRFILIILIFGISLFIKTSYDKLFLDKENNLIVSKEKKNNNNELLSYLYETEVDSGIYEVSNDTNWNTNDYVFNSELSKCQNGSVLSFNETTNKVILKGNKSDKCYLYFDINNGENDDNDDNLNDNTLVAKIKSLYTGTDGVNHIFYHDGIGNYPNADLEAGDNSYRYAGDDLFVYNYVCFGSDEETCPVENLYRIIGVFNNGGEDQVKLIKWDFATSDMLGTAQSGEYTYTASDYANYKGELTTIQRYYWSGSNSTSSTNTWSSSTLNTTALNTNYMTYLGSEWTEMIESTTWKVGGNTAANIYSSNAKTAYTSEIVSPAVSAEYEDEIGLMYVSDYMYAASPTYWSYSGWNGTVSQESTDYRAARNDNWMYSAVHELSITCRSDNTTNSFLAYNAGQVINGNIYDGFGVRPVFNLKSNVVWMGGDGSQNIPYRVGL